MLQNQTPLTRLPNSSADHARPSFKMLYDIIGHLVKKITKIFERWSISWAVEGNVWGESDFLWFLKHKCLAYSRYSVILYILLLLFPTVLLSFCPFARFVHLFILSTCPFCPLVRSVHLSIMSTCSFCSLVQSVLIHKTEMTRKINK